MKTNSNRCFAVMFAVSIYSFSLIGCTGTTTKNNDSNKNKSDSTEIKKENQISIETINYDNLPENYQEQIEGAGCAFSEDKDGESVISNGLMKINGLYEFLEYVETHDRKEMLYINKNWEFEIKIEYEKNTPGDGSEIEGTATLKSRNTNDIKKIKIFGGCGC
jgi:hypothetical protein